MSALARPAAAQQTAHKFAAVWRLQEVLDLDGAAALWEVFAGALRCANLAGVTPSNGVTA